MHKANSLNKMLLLSPEVYNILKGEIEQSANLSLFDKSMNKILKSKNLSDKEKWYNYRNELIKFFNVKRKKAQVIETQKTKIPIELENSPLRHKSLRDTNLYLPREENVRHKSLRDSATQTKMIFKDEISTQTSPVNFGEEIFEIEETTPPRRSLSPAAKRRLSASGIAKSLKTPKVPRLQNKDYKVITDADGITQYTVPVDMSIDEAASLIDELEQDDPKEKVPARRPILRPSQLDPRQYELAFPAKKGLRQSERLKGKKERSASVPDVAWVRF